MRTYRNLPGVVCLALLVALATTISTAQESTSPRPEIAPTTTDISVGQKVKFTAFLKDAAGKKTNAPATAWFAAPFDLAAIDESGTVSFFSPGEVWWEQSWAVRQFSRRLWSRLDRLRALISSRSRGRWWLAQMWRWRRLLEARKETRAQMRR